jgi:hypothetical protein
MFDQHLPPVPAFFEFFSPVYFDGVGYVEKVALAEEFADAQCPTVSQYIAAADGYVFVANNGAYTCVSSANVKFLAGKLAGVVKRPADSKENGVAGKGATDNAQDRKQEKVALHGTPPEDVRSQHTAADAPPKPVRAKPGPKPKAGGAW